MKRQRTLEIITRDSVATDLLAISCYHACVLLLKNTFLPSFLLVGLLVCPSAALCGFNQGQSERKTGPLSVRSAASPGRSYALTSFQRQRTAGDSQKKNRVKHPVIPAGLVPLRLGAPGAGSCRRLVAPDEHSLYWSTRFSRPIGRGPPSSA